ncbi:DUF1697 domain-containing protein [Streptomyces genisteinicus]|uniref:DUF1697 domain-containing protein n=1 Tax=Streptomyces genisteinicus TaxID=2768068 RepID=A0A7H0HZW3_9ACTN|nr:DUF1697 domain-containing protein [Streptomyces genisteinicus]QNP66079.1 DUF1697 domain-containing protein [Streptomyces genisteinicus]
MTARYAVLLRGINVGGAKRVPMAELRTVLAGLGHDDVATYLQSGNAVLTAEEGDGAEEALAARIEAAIEKAFGFRVDTLVRDGAYLRRIAEACPFPAAELQGKQLHAVFLSGPPDAGKLAAVDAAALLPEEFGTGERVLYLHTPGGLGRSKLAQALARPSLLTGLVATTRNWNTVVKLLEMTRDR